MTVLEIITEGLLEHGLIRARERADAGTAIAVVSTDFEEVATICTRVLVFRNGLIAAELKGDAITVENLLTLAAGGTAHAVHATPEPETAA